MTNTTQATDSAIEQNPEYLWRYMRPGLINSKDESIFDLRVEPPEDYVSFFEGCGDSYSQIANSALKNIRARRQIKPTGRIISIKTEEALQIINFSKNLITFKSHDRPHYGMHYLTSNDQEILEVKTVLESISNEYSYNSGFEVMITHDN